MSDEDSSSEEDWEEARRAADRPRAIATTETKKTVQMVPLSQTEDRASKSKHSK